MKIFNKIHRFYNKTASKYGHSALAGIFALTLLINHTALAISHNPETGKPMNQIEVELTAFSSTKSQTDSTPFIAASGKKVYDGMVAANFLPFGTKIKIPELFGDKIFTVDDRMNKRYQNRIDIWFAKTSSAVKFGVQKATIEIVD
jgi:3D (Asp-Asp-Asp) domain-containing protein